MDAFFILVCTYAASIFERHVLQRTEKNEWITFGLCSFLVQPFLSQDIFWFSQLFFTFLFCLFEQDRHTYYISWHWLIVCVCIAIGFVGTFQSLPWQGALLYSVPALFLHRRKPEWIGIAVVYFLGFFGCLLGMHRMMVAVLISVLFGLLWSVFRQKKMIAYVSCLCVGVWIAYVKGYYLWDILFSLLSTF